MSDDEDKTVIRSLMPSRGEGAGPGRPEREGADAGVDDVASRLPIGTRIEEFEIVGVIGEGGFGIVYLARDCSLDRVVAIKEYMPSALASRVRTSRVAVKSARHEETFDAGLRSFINEARLLARFDHPSLLKVYRFWEANGTAYMAMPYYEGVTLKTALAELPGPPNEQWLRDLLVPLLDALQLMHREHCYHRDIAPDNILILAGSQRPLLLDFGAARRVIGDMTQALTVILKPGYAPVEQYADVESLRQGPWTDIYAMGAVIHYAIAGRPPPVAVGRMIQDDYAPLAIVAAGRYSETFLLGVDHALAVRPEARPQSVPELAAALGLPEDVSGGSGKEILLGNPPGRRKRWIALGVAAVAAVAAVATAVAFLVSRTGTETTVSSRTGATSAADGKVGGQVGGQVDDKAGRTMTGTPTQAAGNAARDVATDRVGASAVSPVGRENGAGQVSSPTGTTGAGSPSESLSGPVDLAAEMARAVQLSAPALALQAQVTRAVARIGTDRLQFKLTPPEDGFLYVFVLDPGGSYLQLFPNGLDADNVVKAGRALTLPRSNWPMVAGEPAGANRFLAIFSPQPRDFSGSGLRPDAVFAQLPASEVNALGLQRTVASSPLAGVARCPAQTRDCPQRYGATLFKIDVVASSR